MTESCPIAFAVTFLFIKTCDESFFMYSCYHEIRKKLIRDLQFFAALLNSVRAPVRYQNAEWTHPVTFQKKHN